MKGSINGIKCLFIDLLIWEGKKGADKCASRGQLEAGSYNC